MNDYSNIQLESLFDVGGVTYGHFFNYNDDSTFIISEDDIESGDPTKAMYTVKSDGYVADSTGKYVGRFSLNEKDNWYFACLLDKKVIVSKTNDLLRFETQAFTQLITEGWKYDEV